MKKNENSSSVQNIPRLMNHNKHKSSFLLSTSNEILSPSLSKNNSTAAMFIPPKTKLDFYRYGYGDKDKEAVKTKYMDFSSLLNEATNAENAENQTYFMSNNLRINNSEFTLTNFISNSCANLNIKRVKGKSRSTYTERELNVPNNIYKPENLLFKTPPQLDTIKNREKKKIRNRRLSVEQELVLPKVNYIVNTGIYSGTKTKVPDIWKFDSKIKEQVHRNYMKTLLTEKSPKGSPNNSIQEIEDDMSKDFNDRSCNSEESDDNIETKTFDSKKLVEKIEREMPNLDVFKRFSNIYDHFVSEEERKKEEEMEIQRMTNFEKMIQKKKTIPFVRGNTRLKTIIDKEQEFEIRTKKKEILNLKKETDMASVCQFGQKHHHLNELFHKVEQDHLNADDEYRKLKDPFEKYKMRNILDNRDFSINSKLYVLNKNPLFQINNTSSFPSLMEDPNVLATIYNINMYKLEKMAKDYKKQNKGIRKE